jgi:hypothetical protein
VRRGAGAFALIVVAILVQGFWAPDGPTTRFEITFPAELREEPVVGRVYVLLMRSPDSRARTQRSFGHQPVSNETGEPFFAVDVDGLRPGEAAVIDAGAIGYPIGRLADLPPGDYWAQAILNVYTEFQRSDGHTLWLHKDQWEGQRFAWSPGNFISDVVPVRIDPERGFNVQLELNHVLPPVEIPSDTEWVRRVKIQSQLLSEFWGQPMEIGATVLLPRGFDKDADTRYPAVYIQGHFGLEPPYSHSPEPVAETPEEYAWRTARGLMTGYTLHEQWVRDDFPRVVLVTFQHPTPYFGASYAVNSANNGPYAEALITELIPYLERQFRLIPEEYARIVTGVSTGGYQALALQVHHPRTFGGAWVFCPDPVDFRRLFKINIYEDENAFDAPGYELLRPQRYAVRLRDGQPIQSVRQLSALHDALGTRGRSGEYLGAWEAAFGPVGTDGYPRSLWDRATGQIHREVAQNWRDQGYDLTHYLSQNWPRIGPDLVGKINLFCGDMDEYYFNLSIYGLEEVLESTANPYYAGSFQYGRPLQGHGWRPMDQVEQIRVMAAHVARNAPQGQDASAWYGSGAER